MTAEEIAGLIARIDAGAVSGIDTALSEGHDPVDLLQRGVIRGLRMIGERFEAKEYFIPELMLGGRIAEDCIARIEPHLPDGAAAAQGVVVIGAVYGDLHDLGYGLVATQLRLAGFKVHQLGVNIPAMTFIDKARELDADIIGLSAFLVTTIPNCAEVIEYVRDLGLADHVQVIMGGAETSQEKADGMGADGWAPNAVEAVRLCRRLMERRNAGNRAPGGASSAESK